MAAKHQHRRPVRRLSTTDEGTRAPRSGALHKIPVWGSPPRRLARSLTRHKWWVVGVWLGCAMAAPSGLILVKKCGDLHCKLYEYCSDGTCHNCSNVCSPPVNITGGGGHNYDPPKCEEQCQDYIHDKVKHYVNIAEATDMQNETRETIDGLRTMVAFSLTLSLLVGVAMLAGLGFAWLKYRRVRQAANREKELAEKKMSTISTITTNMGNNNKVQSEVQTIGAPSVVTTTTPISTRHPSEDATLEGYAYDNPGMTPSPVLADNRGETHF